MEYRGALVCACSQRYPGAVEGSMVAERQPKKVVKKPSARRGKSQAGARVSKKSKSSAEAIVKLIDPARLPLFTLLSFVLVAFTIEFDNEGEHRMAHGARGRVAHVDGDVPQLYEVRAGGGHSPWRVV